MFLAAKISIVDIAVMKHKLIWIMLNEKLLCILQDKQTKFKDIWDP